MFSKSSLFVFLTVALSATSALAGVSARPNGNAQVGRRFDSDDSSNSYDNAPACTRKVVNIRGVKKVIRNEDGPCKEVDDLRTDEDEGTNAGNTGGTNFGNEDSDDEVDGTERDRVVDEDLEPLSSERPEDDTDSEEDDVNETSQPNGSDEEEDDDDDDGHGSYDDSDDKELSRPVGNDQGIY